MCTVTQAHKVWIHRHVYWLINKTPCRAELCHDHSCSTIAYHSCSTIAYCTHTCTHTYTTTSSLRFFLVHVLHIGQDLGMMLLHYSCIFLTRRTDNGRPSNVASCMQKSIIIMCQKEGLLLYTTSSIALRGSDVVLLSQSQHSCTLVGHVIWAV